MSIIKYEPLPEIVSLRQAMDRLFQDSFIRPSSTLSAFGEGGMPAIDVYQTPGEVVVKVSAPGLKPEDISIDSTGDTLTIKGESKTEEEIKKEAYLYQERSYGSFCRSINLPNGLQSDKAEANLEDGVLTISIPKAEEVKPKEIKIKTKEKK
ncbi:MAG: Hsp20/alpha crystallin family protein [Chloroflexota bacterium]|nr:Hsp20/alpha crystallin family protein [Chloroflexota bacterium]